MKTLPKSITQTFFDSPDGYQKFDTWFKNKVNSKQELTCLDYLIAQMVRGRDWTAGCGTLTNPRKISHGGSYNYGPYKAIKQFHYLAKQVSDVIPGASVYQGKYWVDKFYARYDNIFNYQFMETVSKLLPDEEEIRKSCSVSELEPYKVVIDCPETVEIKEKEAVPVKQQSFIGKLVSKIWG